MTTTTIAVIFSVLQKNIPEAMRYIYDEGYSTGVVDALSYLSEMLGVSPSGYFTGASLLLDALNTTEGEFIYMASDTEVLRIIDNKLDRLDNRIDRVETKIDKLSTDFADIKVDVGCMNERLKVIENKREKTLPVLTTIAVYATLGVTLAAAIYQFFK